MFLQNAAFHGWGSPRRVDGRYLLSFAFDLALMSDILPNPTLVANYSRAGAGTQASLSLFRI